MDKLFGGVSTIEGLIGTALIGAFVLLLAKPVRKALSGEGDQTLAAMQKLAEAMEANAKSFDKNMGFFERLLERVDRIEAELAKISLDTHDIKEMKR